MMREDTVNSLRELSEAHWFSKIGEPIRSEGIVQVFDWTSAITEWQRPEWRHFCVWASVRQHNGVSSLHGKGSPSWNEHCSEWSKAAEAVASQKLPLAANLESDMKVMIRTLIFRFVAECEYSDVLAPGFFSGLMYFYRDGHFPCGWRGEFPTGKLVVY